MNFFKQLRRFVNKGNLDLLVRDQASLCHALHHQWVNGFGPTVETLFDRKFTHVAAFSSKNAGDTLLPTVLRDLFNMTIGGIQWNAKHVYDQVTDEAVHSFNEKAAVVIGGGGLFLRDTNNNNISGWQWPISTEHIQNIQSKIIVFAVGYNKFRGQDAFDEMFKANVQALIGKAAFVGLRNHGSIRSIKEFLPADLHGKIDFQPCMTTLLRKIYPEHFAASLAPSPDQQVIALNCAFDRSNLRFGGREQEILRDIAKAMRILGKEHRIAYYAHTRGDEAVIPVLRSEGVEFELVRMYDRPSQFVVDCYRRAKLTIGMRGHAQMIPFGCGQPILSLISHDKMRWFLDDIHKPEWGIEVAAPKLAENIVDSAEDLLRSARKVAEDLSSAQEMLWQITAGNMRKIAQGVLPQVA